MELLLIFQILFFVSSFFKFSLQLDELLDNSFVKQLNSKEISTILFLNPWCFSSKKALDSFNKTYTNHYKNSQKIKFFTTNTAKNKGISKFFSITGCPTLIFFVKNNNNKKNYTINYQEDLENLQYFINLQFFSILPIETFENINKTSKAFVCGINKRIFDSNFERILQFSKENPLYVFILFKGNTNVSYIILKKYENFFVKYISTKEKQFFEEFQSFFIENHRPLLIKTFDHSIKNYILHKEIYCITLFYRKKLKILDKNIQISFEKLVNFVKNINKSQEFYRNYQKFLENLVFFMLDPIEKFNRRLAFFLGVSEDELPLVVFFVFDNNTKEFYKYKYQKQDFYSEELVTIAQTVLNKNNRDYNNLLKNSMKNSKKMSKVMNINYFAYKKLIKLIENKENQIFVFEISFEYCLFSKILSGIIEKLAKSLTKYYNFDISYYRLDILQNDFEKNQIKTEQAPTIIIKTNKNTEYLQNIQEFSLNHIEKSLKNTINQMFLQQKQDL